MNTKASFDNIINCDVDKIVDFINEVNKKNANSSDKLREIIKDSDFYNKYEVLCVPSDVFLKNILMCLVYSDIDPYLANTPIMEGYKEKVKSVCHTLNLDVNNIVPICTIEKKLINELIL